MKFKKLTKDNIIILSLPIISFITFYLIEGDAIIAGKVTLIIVTGGLTLYCSGDILSTIIARTKINLPLLFLNFILLIISYSLFNEINALDTFWEFIISAILHGAFILILIKLGIYIYLKFLK